MLLMRGLLACRLLVGSLLACSLLVGCAPSSSSGNAPRSQGMPRTEIVVFAAASLTDALTALADSFEADHPGYRLTLNVAGTSTLARQIDSGAKADLFFSANEEWMTFLKEQDRVAPPVRTPLTNRLVVVGRRDGPRLSTPRDLAALARIALADPAHVPAGLYAKEGLQCAGLWTDVRPHLIPALDVRAALLTVENGAAQAAIVYASDALVSSRVRVLFEWPPSCQPSIRYAAAVLTQAPHPEAARLLLDYIAHPDRATLWTRFGFTPTTDPA